MKKIKQIVIDCGHGGIDKNGKYTTAPAKQAKVDGKMMYEGVLNRTSQRDLYTSTRSIENIFVHCTGASQKQTVKSILNHWKNNLGWSRVGYHFIVSADGELTQLSSLDKYTFGVRGLNGNSIHICYIGGAENGKAVDNRTDAQKETLTRVISKLKRSFPGARVLGHRDISPDQNGDGTIQPHERIKECPCFDAIPEYEYV